jgi:Protein kinase domain
MLLPEMADNDAALALFRKEASALHYLVHDAIVRYFVFTVEPILRRPYLAMEFVDGHPLSEILAAGPLELDRLQRLIRRVASGLGAAHDRGIIHRDVSPDNIIVPHGDFSRAKIIDFGIARLTQFGDTTIIGSAFAGKLNYASPEQVGLFGGEVTAKSDIYSLGLILLQALTGHKLDMGGSQFELVEKRRRVPDLSAVDVRFRPLLERMLQPDPNDRAASMAEIESWNFGASTALPARIERGAAAVLSEVNRPRPAWRRRNMAAAAILVLGSAIAGYLYFWAPDSWTPSSGNAPATPTLTPTLVPGPGASPPADKDMSAPKMPNAAGGRNAVLRFIEQYDGGECFLISPVAVSDGGAVVEGLGFSTRAFDLLDKAFLNSQGFEASIGVRLVTPPQCPAISFLNQLRDDRAHAPKITLSSVKLRAGEQLVGTIENFADRKVELLLITESGMVYNQSQRLQPGLDALSFSIDLPRGTNSAGTKVPQLVLAVASTRAVTSLHPPAPSPAQPLFEQVLSDARSSATTISASARYVTVEY